MSISRCFNALENHLGKHRCLLTLFFCSIDVFFLWEVCLPSAHSFTWTIDVVFVYRLVRYAWVTLSLRAHTHRLRFLLDDTFFVIFSPSLSLTRTQHSVHWCYSRQSRSRLKRIERKRQRRTSQHRVSFSLFLPKHSWKSLASGRFY